MEGPKVLSEAWRSEAQSAKGESVPSLVWESGAMNLEIFEIVHANLYILVLFGVIS